ncbi:MAG TPA: lysylphosphatidylglycerol synthase transmembrane domain-containing protein, partial [Methylomirabilota bacterium]|nr:lysylphosphatidylglycerol synthase transmembrane domain-containing protein [Methylomirabilota bacterium]
RVWVVARRWHAGGRGPAGPAFWLVLGTLVVERILDGLAVVLVLAVLVPLLPVPAALQWAAAALLAVDVLAIGLVVAVARRPGPARAAVRRLTARWPAVQGRADRIVDTLLRGLEGVRARAHALPLLAWTALVWLLPALGAWSMLQAVRLDLPLAAAWTVLAFVGLGISVPSAPGHVGVWHAATALALGVFGVGPPAAVGYALLYHASQYVPITLLGWLALLREHVSLGEATRRRAPAPVPARSTERA